MPFIDSSPTMGVYFNVVNSVGRNASNWGDDVMMVQYMLANIYKHYPESQPPGNMTVDGICGPVTRAWIVHFQDDAGGQAGGFPNGVPDEYARPTTDGRVDRAKGSGVSTISHSYYTIVVLNHALQEGDAGAWARIPALFPMTPKSALPRDDPEFPRQAIPSGGI